MSLLDIAKISKKKDLITSKTRKWPCTNPAGTYPVVLKKSSIQHRRKQVRENIHQFEGNPSGGDPSDVLGSLVFGTLDESTVRG